MLFAMSKIEMKRTCLFPVCFQLSLSCLFCILRICMKINTRKISAACKAKPDEFGSSFPKWGCVPPPQLQAVPSPPPATVPAGVSTDPTAAELPLSLGVWPPAAPCVLALLTLLTFSGCCSSSHGCQSCAPAPGWICQGATTEALGKISLPPPLLLEIFLQMPVAHPSSMYDMYPFPGLPPSLLRLGGFCCQSLTSSLQSNDHH